MKASTRGSCSVLSANAKSVQSQGRGKVEVSDRETIARALRQIPYGLYVLGSLNDGNPATIVANWVTQVSFRPPSVGIAVEEDSKMRKYIETSSVFSVNILRAGSTEFAKAFLKGAEAKGDIVAGKEYSRARHGTPFLAAAAAAFECSVISRISVGDHVLFIGEVVDAVAPREQSEILTLRETGWKYSR
jgi:flavin reductase (DIM6/NTAB) family NADH-FMN oxidoreductase RutF